MAVYAIGDVQGCYDQLRRLLDLLNFDPVSDRLWLVGDLVNRGPRSVETLQYVMGLGKSAVTVLGNHDLHVMALAMGLRKHSPRDQIDSLLSHKERDVLFDWLRRQPLLHHDDSLGYTMVHAGLAPEWDLDTARRCAREVESVLESDQCHDLIRAMYGDEPDRWSSDVRGIDRWRFIINCFTRIRYCDAQGRLVLKDKGPPRDAPAGLVPWFQVPSRKSRDLKIIFGHWSTLGRYDGDGVYCIDSGCVWGGALTALRIDRTPQWHSIPCPESCPPHAG